MKLQCRVTSQVTSANTILDLPLVALSKAGAELVAFSLTVNIKKKTDILIGKN